MTTIGRPGTLRSGLPSRLCARVPARRSARAGPRCPARLQLPPPKWVDRLLNPVPLLPDVPSMKVTAGEAEMLNDLQAHQGLKGVNAAYDIYQEALHRAENAFGGEGGIDGNADPRSTPAPPICGAAHRSRRAHPNPHWCEAGSGSSPARSGVMYSTSALISVMASYPLWLAWPV